MPETVTLGGRVFELKAMPWGQLRKLAAAINRVGQALAVGSADEAMLDDMGSVVSIGLGLEPAELDELPTDWHEISNAFRALMRVSGMEREMEYALGEARRRGHLLGTPASTGGTASTPKSPASPDGPGTSSTT